MISYLNGAIENVSDKQLVIDVGGIGYCVNIPASTSQNLPAAGSSLKIWISESTAMYGGDTTYYGFLTEEERDVFNLIKSVSKIGAKAALDILSKVSKSFPDFKEAIINKNTGVLTGVLGLTPKTAEKLIPGLKGKIKNIELKGKKKILVEDEQFLLDAIEGLISMGYRESESRQAVRLACENLTGDSSTENIIKQALKKFKR